MQKYQQYSSTQYSKDFFSAVKDSSMSMIDESGLPMQLFLAVFAVAAAFLISMLVQRIVKRRLADSRHADVINGMLASVAFPFTVILCLVTVNWIATMFPIIQGHNIIPSISRIALIWLISSILLLLSHRHFIAYFISGLMLSMTLLNVTGLLAPTLASLSKIAFETEKFRISLLDVIRGIFTMVLLFWGAGVLTQSGERWLRRSHLTFNARELAIKFLRIILYFLAFMFTLTEMGVDLTALTVFGGALAVGLGFGLQKISSNFLSGIVLLFEKAIEAGDLIEVGNEKGWVRQMAIRHTLIETFDGREVLVPNEDLIIGKVTNWTYTNTRARIDVTLTITYSSDVGLARKLMIEAAKAHRLCISEPPPAAHVREFTDRGIQIMLVFWIPDVNQGMVSSKSDVMLQIVQSFRENGIRFAEIKYV